MKPRNKFEKRIIEITSQIKPISSKQLNWFQINTFKHYGYRTKTKGTTCMECSFVFDTKLNKCKCPNCKVDLIIENTRKSIKVEDKYVALIETIQEFQVIRYYNIWQNYRKGNKAVYLNNAVCINFLNDAGCLSTVSKLNPNGYFGCFIWGGKLEIREFFGYKHDIYVSSIYPKMSIRDIYKQRGLTNNFFDIRPLFMFRELLFNPKIETLLKAWYISFIEHSCYKSDNFLVEFWSTIKICIRNKYVPSDIGIWLDYLRLLKFFNKDLLNRKFVCPINLMEEHDKYVDLKEQYDTRESLIRDKENLKLLLERKRKGFIVLCHKKKVFKDLVIPSDKILIKPLLNIREYKYEAEVLKHCVYTNTYWDKIGTLVLSARIDNKPIETIEVSLDDYNILQCRGKDNQNSKWHKAIVNIVENNINLIIKHSSQWKRISQSL